MPFSTISTELILTPEPASEMSKTMLAAGGTFCWPLMGAIKVISGGIVSLTQLPESRVKKPLSTEERVSLLVLMSAMLLSRVL